MPANPVVRLHAALPSRVISVERFQVFKHSGPPTKALPAVLRTCPIYPTFPIWLNIPLSKSSAFFKPLSICETLAVGMAIITP